MVISNTWIKVIFIKDLHNHENPAKSWQWPAFGEERIVKTIRVGPDHKVSHAHHKRQKANWNSCKHASQYEIIGHNTSFARFFIIFFSAVLQVHIKEEKNSYWKVNSPEACKPNWIELRPKETLVLWRCHCRKSLRSPKGEYVLATF